jgi:hypothetical protein
VDQVALLVQVEVVDLPEQVDQVDLLEQVEVVDHQEQVDHPELVEPQVVQAQVVHQDLLEHLV